MGDDFIGNGAKGSPCINRSARSKEILSMAALTAEMVSCTEFSFMLGEATFL